MVSHHCNTIETLHTQEPPYHGSTMYRHQLWPPWSPFSLRPWFHGMAGMAGHQPYNHATASISTHPIPMQETQATKISSTFPSSTVSLSPSSESESEPEPIHAGACTSTMQQHHQQQQHQQSMGTDNNMSRNNSSSSLSSSSYMSCQDDHQRQHDNHQI